LRQAYLGDIFAFAVRSSTIDDVINSGPVMRKSGGVDFDIMTWPRRLVRAYPEIVRALEGVEFAFSSRSVSPDCKVSYADLLTRRP